MEAPKDQLKSYTGLVIRNDEGKFLTMHFTQKKERMWRFAGGKVEPGEQPIICAARELKEELGVEASSLRLVFTHTHKVDSGVWTGYYFVAEALSGTPGLMELDKHDQITYRSSAELEALGSHPEAEVAKLLEEI